MNEIIEVELSYGEKTLLKLREFFPLHGENKVPSDFWEWRKENKLRANVLNKAGLELDKLETGFVANMSKVCADSLDNAREGVNSWKRAEKEIAERAHIYLRQCDAMKYAPGGQFGGRA